MVHRWPIILTKLIDHIHNVNHKLTISNADAQRIEEGLVIIGKISKLKYEMARDRTLECVCLSSPSSLRWREEKPSTDCCSVYTTGAHGCRPIPDDGEADVETYNNELAALTEKGKGTWFTCPWLYAEYVASHFSYSRYRASLYIFELFL